MADKKTSGKVSSAIDSLKQTYKDRVTKGKAGNSDYIRYENGNKNAGVFSAPDRKGAYYNNEDGTSVYGRKFNDAHNSYVAGISNPNWNLPDGEREITTPLGTLGIGSDDDGETAYATLESPIEKYRNVMPNGDTYDNISYAPTNNSAIYASKSALANGEHWYDAGIQSPLFNSSETWNETETPLGTVGAGYGGGGAGVAFSPNENTQALYNNFLKALASLRR